MKTFKVMIDDLELVEAQEIQRFLIEKMESDELPYSLHDCIFVVDSDGNPVELCE